MINNKKFKNLFKIISGIFLLFFIIVQGIIIRNYKSDIVEGKKLDYIIILGAKVVEKTPSKPLMERIKKAVEYLNDNPESRAIATGGKGNSAIITEAEAIKRELISEGIAENRIILEDNSTNTLENLKYSMELIKKDRKEENISDLKIGIVTNNFHIFRSKNIAMDIGFSNVYGISAKTPLIAIPKAHVREFFSIIKYFWKKMNK